VTVTFPLLTDEVPGEPDVGEPLVDEPPVGSATPPVAAQLGVVNRSVEESSAATA